MDSANWVARIASIVIALALPVILIATPLYLFISPGFVRYEYARPSFPPSIRFSDAERLRISDTMIGYLRGWNSAQEMATVATDSGEQAMRADESQHIIDVKVVTDGFFVAHAIALVASVLAAIALVARRETSLIASGLAYGFWITCGLIVFVLLAAIIDFNTFFMQFHRIFFTEGSWLFYEEDTLIQLYPLPFWSDTVIKLGIVIVAEACLVWIVQRLTSR